MALLLLATTIIMLLLDALPPGPPTPPPTPPSTIAPGDTDLKKKIKRVAINSQAPVPARVDLEGLKTTAPAVDFDDDVGRSTLRIEIVKRDDGA